MLRRCFGVICIDLVYVFDKGCDWEFCGVVIVFFEVLEGLFIFRCFLFCFVFFKFNYESVFVIVR